MDKFEGRVAVVTGGGTGMGSALVARLASEGCHVATCDVSADAMEATRSVALAGAPAGTKVTTFVADVANEAQVLAFRDSVVDEHHAACIHLLFNNAGIAGGGSFVSGDRVEWERTFGVDWGGVYLCTRAFLPLLLAADAGHVINTSSVNGLWASIGPSIPHTSYSAAKFAVRGFTEALMCDFRLNAPHLRASVVLPGHVGTSIVLNSAVAHERPPESLTAEDLLGVRQTLEGMGVPTEGISDEDLRKGMQLMGENFRDAAPLSADDAAVVILEGVRQNKWRILVGADAEFLDAEVRADPEHAYEPEFWDRLRAAGHFGGFGS